MKKVGIAVAAAGAAVTAGFVYTLKRGFDELSEGQQVMAQTQAAMKSTGSAAHVTAKQVEELAQAQSKLTGIDDEAVQAGENMLLTFTNIRNEVGKGNDIFNQATVAVEDLATRMKDGAIPSGEELSKTAIRVGKALNDPIKGMTALSRVGVQFTDAQRKQITEMVKSGDVMGAQKVILRELTKEFGGSAKAAGTTLPGQLAKLRNAFDEVSGEIAVKVLPALISILDWINQNWDSIAAVISGTSDVIIGVFKTLKNVVVNVFNYFSEHRDQFAFSAAAIATVLTMGAALEGIRAALVGATAAQAAFNLMAETNPYIAVASAIVALTVGLVVLYKTSDTARGIMQLFWQILRDTATAIAGPVIGAFRALVGIIKSVEVSFGPPITVIRAFAAIFKASFQELVIITRGTWAAIKAIVGPTLSAIQGVIRSIMALIRGDWSRAWEGIKQVALGILSAMLGPLGREALEMGRAVVTGVVKGLVGLPAAIQGAFAGAGHWLHNAGLAILQGLWDGLKEKWDAVADWLGGLGGKIVSLKGPPGQDAVLLRQVGQLIMQGLDNGLRSGWSAIERTLSNMSPKIAGKMKEAVGAAQRAISDAKGGVVQAMSALVDAALAAFDRLSSELTTKAGRQLAALEAKHQAAELARAKAEADKAVADAQAALDSMKMQEGETPEEFAARQAAATEALKQAKQQQEDALYAIQVAALQRQQAAQEAAQARQRETQRVHLENELNAAAGAYNRGAISLEQYNQRVLNILAKYGIPYKKAAAVLGAALAKGLTDAFEDVQKAAKALANVIVTELSKIRVIVNVELQVKTPKPPGKMAGGPVYGGYPYIVGEAGPELFVPSTSGRIIPNSKLNGGGGGGIVVNVYNAGSVIAERDLVESVRNGLLAKQRQIGTLGFN